MARGLGRALQRAVSREGFDVDLDAEGGTLANARRRHVFRYLCERPCARIGEIGKRLGMSQATVRWHVWDLVKNGYLDVDQTHMFPAGLINPEDAGLFATLAGPGRSAVLAATFAAPGISFQDLADRVGLTRQSISKIASEIAGLGLVSLSDDGRYHRVFPTDSLARKRDSNRGRAGAFAENLIRRLGSEGLSPELLRRDEAALLVRFGTGGQRVVLEVPLDPYGTAWQREA